MYWKFLPAINVEESQGYRMRDVQSLPTLKGGQKVDPGSTAFSNTNLGTLWIIPWWISPGPLQREPELCARAPCIQNQQHCLSHSIQGAEGLGVTALLHPLLCSSENPEQPKPRLAREPDPELLPTGDYSTLRGALVKSPHLSQHSKAGDTPLSHFHIFTKVLPAGRKHFPQKTQWKQELFLNFIFDKGFSFQTGVRGQQGGNGLSKNSHSAFFKCFVGPGYKEIRERVKSMLRNILESFQSLGKVFWFPLLLIIYHKISRKALWLQPVKITSSCKKILHYCFLLNCPRTASYKKVEISRKCIHWEIQMCWIPHQRKRHFYWAKIIIKIQVMQLILWLQQARTFHSYLQYIFIVLRWYTVSSF